MNYWDLPYQGAIDQLKIFDEPITAENVQALYAENARVGLPL